MANPVKGEVEFEAEGVVYTLRFTVNAVVSLEEATGSTFPALSADLSDPLKVSMKLVRLLFWAALQDAHPTVDVLRAGDLIPHAGGMVGAMALIVKALERSFPAQEGASKGRPPRPGQRVTGPAH